jgi:penicillin amidase
VRALVVVVVLLLAAPARAGVLQAETVLPPGQSGFVSIPGVADGTGSPHLYDQTDLFVNYRWKPALFGQPGETETPRDGVSIVRDKYGVPSITGANENDMWWGAGYAGAQDRLFELDLFRHATTGRLSEIIGSGRLDDDRMVRQDLYTPAELDAMYAKLDPAFQQRFQAITDGINAWIDHVQLTPGDLPAEYPATGTTLEPWTVHDSVAVGVYLARTIPTNADPEGLELANLRALHELGPSWFQRLLPLRQRHPLTTIPGKRFVSQPGRSRADERRGFRRSQRFAKTLPTDVTTTAIATPAPSRSSFTPRLGGSYMFAIRESGNRALLFNGPQLGFDAPEKLLELELHAPGIDLRGMTAPGVPIIGAGFNGHGVAWGVTTGASDTDDLYAERLVPGHPEQYRYKGEVRDMDCRDEVFNYDSPPSDLLGAHLPQAGSKTVRLCRTVHGPVEARADGIAYARRYATWKRELETLSGLAAVNDARSITDVDRAMRKVTWNENLMAADAGGHIGYWHPGLFPLRSRRWDERLPLPGTGQAEWRGLLPRSRIPSVIDPKRGWLVNWNNLPAHGWTSGDGTARKRLDGQLFRVGLLNRLVERLARKPSFGGIETLLKSSGTVAQQRPALDARLRRMTRGSSGGAGAVLKTLRAWNGSYGDTASDGTVDPGVATWDAFREAMADELVRRAGKGALWLAGEDVLGPLYGGYHHGAPYHFFDLTHLQSQAMLQLGRAGWRRAARTAFATLAKHFGSEDPATWREPRRMYEVGAVGATAPPPMPFFDRGTYEQLVEVGPG